MQAHPAIPSAKPLLGLLAELRALAQPRPETAGPLAPLHALVLALLAALIALLESLPDREHPATPRPSRAWRRAARHPAPRPPNALAYARIIHVVGPAPRRGMRLRAPQHPAPEPRPPKPHPAARTAPRRARAPAPARSHPLADQARSSGNTGRRSLV